MDRAVVVDWALFIFGQMCDLVTSVPFNSRLWFPCMITAECRKQGVTGQAYKKMEKLDPGVIDMSTLKRSKSQTKGAPVKASKPSQEAGSSHTQHLPPSPKSWTKAKAPPKGSRMVTWLKQLLKCHRAGLKNQEKIMRKQEKLERGQKRIDAKTTWVIEQLEASSSARYVPPQELEDPSEEEEFEEEEEEDESDSEEE